MKRKEINKNIETILEQFEVRSFLEIGLGPKLRPSRLETINRLGIRFTGLDFQPVCDTHAAERDRLGISPDRMRYVGNTTGTYLYNLIRLKREGAKFDFIYLDGHHTMYVDFAAAMACIPLLNPGALIAFDDVTWTLAEKEESLGSSEFYKDMYDFSAYTSVEKAEAHIGVIANEYFRDCFGFEEVEQFSAENWKLLVAPKSIALG
ncbi:MAG: class I SAM-dependent methyltransferase [Roseovarius sp.]